jgi:KDO2-lipid IV(A) lauroyltransferase
MSEAWFQWLSRRRLRTLHAWGTVLGWLAWVLSPRYRARLMENAALAGVPAAPRRAAVAEAGRMVLELPRLWGRAPGLPIEDPVRWEGAELVEAALGHPGGLMLLTPHLGCFEMCAQAYAERFGASQPLTVLYRPARQAWLRRVEETARSRPGLATAPATLPGVRQLLRALKRGETIGLLPDQVPPEGQGVWAPFFGRPAYTMTLAPRLAAQTGARVLAMWCERLPHGAGFVVRVQELPGALPAGDEAAAAFVNAAMEGLIRQHPAQYLWAYHRYKAPRGAA